MADLDDVLNHPVTAAGAGSFVALLFARKMTWPQAIMSWVAGVACAHYLAPLVIAHWKYAASAPNATIFLVGAFGVQIVAIVYDIVVVFRENPQATLAMVLEVLLKKKDIKP